MTWTIAVAGKGGTGKTTVASLLVRNLIQMGKTPVLAVDADPDANFSTGVGVKVHKTIGQILQEWLDQKLNLPGGISKQEYLTLKLNQAIEEKKNFDLITMGRPHGPGCYCSANSVLRDFVDQLKKNYSSLVVDNEAGMEHLSRKIIDGIDVLVMVADPTPVGVRTTQRLIELANELNMKIGTIALLINRVKNEITDITKEIVKQINVDVIDYIPVDEMVEKCSLEEISLITLPDHNNAVRAVKSFLEKLQLDANEKSLTLS